MCQCKYFAIFCWILWMETISIFGQVGSQASMCRLKPISRAFVNKNIKFPTCNSRKSGDNCTVECKNGFRIETGNQNSITQHMTCGPPWKTKYLKICISIATNESGHSVGLPNNPSSNNAPKTRRTKAGGNAGTGGSATTRDATSITISSKSKNCSNLTNDNLSDLNIKKTSCKQTNEREVCQLECKDDHILPGGSSKQNIACLADGKWNSTFKKCNEKRCSTIYRNRRDVKCTKDNKIDSQCTLSCGVGSYVKGKNPIVCRQNSDGTVSWDDSEISCEEISAIRCKQYTYHNGVNNRTCTKTALSSTCSVECAYRYQFDGENKIVTCLLKTSDTTAKWSPLNGACTVKILKHESCQYWISNIEAKNKGDAGKKCKELLGSESVLAVTASASARNFLYKNIKAEDGPYLLGAKKLKNGKYIWDNRKEFTTALSSGECAVLYNNKIASESCRQKFICEKPTDSLNGICSPNPCRNGECKPYGCSYKCTCEKKIYGRHCDSGPMTVEFKKNIYSASQNQKVTINVKMNTNRGGKASLDLYRNGNKVETYEINAEDSTTGAQPDYKQYTIENVKENIYVSARGTLQTDTGESHLYVCAKIIPNVATRKIKEVQVSKDQCNATNLLVSWKKLTSTAKLNYTIYVGNVKTYASTHEETSHILSGLEPDKKYTIKVVPDIKGCNNKLDLFDAYESETAGALPGAPKKVNLKIAEKNCKIRWRQTLQKGFGGYQVIIFETARSSSSMNQNEKQQYKEMTSKNTTSQGYSFMANPNSKYMVQIGTIPMEECKKRVPIAWSDEIEGCRTGTAPPGKVKTPTVDLALIQDQTVPITLSPIDERNGPISCYFVVIKMLNSSENKNTSKPLADVSLLKQGNETINVGDHFVSIALKRFRTEQNFRLGTGEMSFCDMRGPINNTKENLTSARIRRAVHNTAVHANNHKLNRDAEYSHYLLVSTPSLDGGEPMLTASDYSPVWSIKKDLAEETNPRGSNKTLAIILPIAVVVLLAVVLGALYLYKRKHPKTQEQDVSPDNIVLRGNIVANQVEEGEYAEINEYAEIAKYDDIGQAKESPDAIANRILANHSLRLSNLHQAMKDKRANEDRIFLKEFKEDIVNATKACALKTNAAKLSDNISKNRFKDIVPYDHSRVVLKKLPGDDFSDYVNAAYIDGYNFPNKFIAAQGPLPNTINEFWRMIWENDCCVIAALTQLKENDKTQCEQYWPNDEGQVAIHGGITVKLVQVTSYCDFVRRQFEVTKNRKVCNVLQYQYVAWPDHGTPVTTSSLMRFHKSVLSAQLSTGGPIVVHCSAGIGRTGLFIGLDLVHDKIRVEEEINICAIVMIMRTRRTEMISTLEQYIYLHKLAGELFRFGETDVDVSKFNSVYSDTKSALERTSKMNQEFAMLSYSPPLDTSQETGSKLENKHSNNDLSVIPYDHNIAASIQIIPTDEKIPYFNASKVLCYQNNAMFIAAQDPTTSTAELFWRLVYDSRVTTIVSLFEKTESGECSLFPNENEELTFGLISIVKAEQCSRGGFVERKFVLTSNGIEVMIWHLQCHQWAESGAPESSTTILEMIANVERHHQSLSNEEKKITLVHCRDGAGRTGAFCAISNLIERLKNEKRVDVFRTVKDLRDQRPLMVRTIEQYVFCYQAVTEYLQTFDLYQNFQ